ncbi:unnamed protein product [Kuraishia capsulata CBS 1993]|uniref:Uncharacterized protein n=1 Tax=Kuraishia capsulata CBS 1993 TaxID=1382522 RepID=W6MTH9_9ASCO|nr:uncharacterized protein KUCA_T00006029001 [Kuraishia capsulata CBS 1993]CDK30034.1 unnamed protein product [Kuraishia capsulata CBS 1993]
MNKAHGTKFYEPHRYTTSNSSKMSESVEPITSSVQFSKLYLTKDEVALCKRATIHDELLYTVKKKEIFQFIKELIKKLKSPLKILQSFGYYFQRFFLFNDFKKNINSCHEIAICALYIAMKNNDYIKRLKDVIAMGNQIRNLPCTSEALDEQKKKIFSFEKKFLEVIAFDFRAFSVEDFLIKYSKTLGVHPDVTYLAWIISNDSYFTELVLTSAPYNISQGCLLLGFDLYEELNPGKLDQEISTWKEGLLKSRKISPNPFFVLSAKNDLLTYFIEQWDGSFLSSMVEAENLNDHILNIKLKLAHEPEMKGRKRAIALEESSDDLFYKPRDYEVGKVGTIRFLYHKREFLEEMRKTV